MSNTYIVTAGDSFLPKFLQFFNNVVQVTSLLHFLYKEIIFLIETFYKFEKMKTYIQNVFSIAVVIAMAQK